MRTKEFPILAGLGGTLIFGSATEASYQGLTVLQHTSGVIGSGVARTVYRVYAVFSDPGDYLSSVAGSPTLGNMVIQTRNAQGSAPGGNFYNPAGGGATAPTFKNLGTRVEWDTFVDIGLASVPYGGTDATGLSPGFAGITGSGINTNNAGWFTAGPKPQGMAGNGTNFGSGLWGVIIMQLTVNQGNTVAGTVAIGGVNNDPLAGGTTFQTNADQTFIYIVPTPGALAVFGVAMIKSRRRR